MIWLTLVIIIWFIVAITLGLVIHQCVWIVHPGERAFFRNSKKQTKVLGTGTHFVWPMSWIPLSTYLNSTPRIKIPRKPIQINYPNDSQIMFKGSCIATVSFNLKISFPSDDKECIRILDNITRIDAEVCEKLLHLLNDCAKPEFVIKIFEKTPDIQKELNEVLKKTCPLVISDLRFNIKYNQDLLADVKRAMQSIVRQYADKCEMDAISTSRALEKKKAQEKINAMRDKAKLIASANKDLDPKQNEIFIKLISLT